MKNKTILITGVSRGLGLELANHWCKENTVIGISRKRSEALNENIAFYSCDLGDEAKMIEALKKIVADHPKIDLLINNAAILTSLPMGVMKTEDIGKMIDVNLKAPIIVSKIVFRKMIQAKSGQIINILSMAAKLSIVGDAVYAATKSGLESFSKVLNKEGHPFGVHVNNIGLTAFPSGMLDQVLAANQNKVLDLIPHHQYAPVDEIKAAIEFFVNNSKDIGGQTLYFGGI